MKITIHREIARITPSFSHIKQKYHEGLIQGKLHIQPNLNEDLEYW